jgi:hypothetical protein
MRFFIRHRDNRDIEGPFTLEQIREMAASQRITADWVATADIGEPLDRVRRSHESDWIYVGELEGVRSNAVAAVPLRTFNYPVFTLWMILLIVLAVLVAGGLFVYFLYDALSHV